MKNKVYVVRSGETILLIQARSIKTARDIFKVKTGIEKQIEVNGKAKGIR